MIREAPRSKEAATIIFVYFNYSFAHISAQTIRRWTAERTQNKVLRIPVMDKVETIKKEYLPGKL